MASAALEAFNAWVDEQRLDAELATALRARAKQLYREASGEQIEHIKFHADIVAADAQESVATQERAAAVSAITGSLIAKGGASTWLDLVTAPVVAEEAAAEEAAAEVGP